jgi:hypothetical protein
MKPVPYCLPMDGLPGIFPGIQATVPKTGYPWPGSPDEPTDGEMKEESDPTTVEGSDVQSGDKE